MVDCFVCGANTKRYASEICSTKCYEKWRASLVLVRNEKGFRRLRPNDGVLPTDTRVTV